MQIMNLIFPQSLVPKHDGQNQEENTLIIETEEIRQGYVDVQFCNGNTNIILNIDEENKGKNSYKFNAKDYQEYEK